MTGLIDGSLSTLAPIFAVALATHRPQYAFFAGLATAIGAGVSMAFSEGLSDAAIVVIVFELLALSWIRARFFGRCTVCTHAAVVREGAACAMCGSTVAAAAAPPDLFSGWRCGCYQCTSTPC